MFELDANVFLQRPEDVEERILHPGHIIDLEDGVTICFDGEEDLIELTPGQELFACVESNRKFVKVPIRIMDVTTEIEDEAVDEKLPVPSPTSPHVRFEATGDPESAESRQCYRVATTSWTLEASVNGETRCPLTDVSVQGFSVISQKPHTIGRSVPATIDFEGELYSGKSRVQSIKLLRGGRRRVGLLSQSKDLERGLRKMSMILQRRQLQRRRAG